MDLSVITVNTNDREKILDQIASVGLGAEGITYEQFVSDNGSSDGSLELIEQKFPGVTIIRNGKNIGFGCANNAAVPVARGEFLLFLNPDMRVEKRSLQKIVDWMRTHPAVGIASCKLVNPDGSFNENTKPRRFPTFLDQAAILLKIPHIFPSVLDGYLYKNFNPDVEQEVDSVRGSFMVVRKSLVEKLGWAFDPRYFIWFEDVDTCREAKKHGYTVMYTPVVSCVDYVGQTFKRQSTFTKQRWFTQSMVTYFRKWGPWYALLVVAALRPVAMSMAYIFEKLQRS